MSSKTSQNRQFPRKTHSNVWHFFWFVNRTRKRNHKRNKNLLEKFMFWSVKTLKMDEWLCPAYAQSSKPSEKKLDLFPWKKNGIFFSSFEDRNYSESVWNVKALIAHMMRIYFKVSNFSFFFGKSSNSFVYWEGKWNSCLHFTIQQRLDEWHVTRDKYLFYVCEMGRVQNVNLFNMFLSCDACFHK